jgi:hypothetical protein
MPNNNKMEKKVAFNSTPQVISRHTAEPILLKPTVYRPPADKPTKHPPSQPEVRPKAPKRHALPLEPHPQPKRPIITEARLKVHNGRLYPNSEVEPSDTVTAAAVATIKAKEAAKAAHIARLAEEKALAEMQAKKDKKATKAARVARLALKLLLEEQEEAPGTSVRTPKLTEDRFERMFPRTPYPRADLYAVKPLPPLSPQTETRHSPWLHGGVEKPLPKSPMRPGTAIGAGRKDLRSVVGSPRNVDSPRKADSPHKVDSPRELHSPKRGKKIVSFFDIFLPT